MTTTTAPAMLAAAQAFQQANYDIPMVVIPLFDGETGKGKYPNHPGGHHPDITSGWQKRIISVPDQHPAWQEATGYGIVLTGNDQLVIIDVDNEDKLTLAQQAALQAAPGLTYFTRKGRHHWYRVTPGAYQPMGGKAYARPWGEMWYYTPRQVAGPGSADKPAPPNLLIPDHIPPIDELLTTTHNLDDWDPPQPEPKGDHDSLRDWIMFQVQNGQTDDTRLYLDGKQTEWYQAIELKRPRLAQQELQNIIAWCLSHGNPQGQPPPTTGPAAFELGEPTQLGQEVLWGDTIVDHIGGKPISLKAWPYQTGHPQYLDFYHQQIRIQIPPPTLITNQNEAQTYLDRLPAPHRVEAQSGDGFIVWGGPDETTMILGQPGQGKTWATMMGIAELDLPTLYIATESLPSAVKRAKLLNINWDNFYLTSQPSAQHLKTLCQLADDKSVQIVVVDVLAHFLDEENSASSFHMFLRYLSPLTANRSLVICHHLGKDKNRGARGSSAMEAATSYDYICASHREDDGTLRTDVRWHRKDKDGHQPTGLTLILAHHNNRFSANWHSLSKEEALDDKHIIDAWYAARNIIAADKLPTPGGVGRQLHQLGHAKSDSTGKNRVNARLKKLFTEHPGKGERGGLGLQLREGLE